MIYFTSDTHWHHTKILQYCSNRQFGSIEEMNEFFIMDWNNKVTNKDTVYHLGDLSLSKGTKVEEILQQLNGKIHLIKGNHDHWLNPDTIKYFESIQDYKEIKIKDIKIILCHFPFHYWNAMHYGSYHLYGHCHNTLQTNYRSMDIGVDTRDDLSLWSFDEIHECLKNKLINNQHADNFK